MEKIASRINSRWADHSGLPTLRFFINIGISSEEKRTSFTFFRETFAKSRTIPFAPDRCLNR